MTTVITSTKGVPCRLKCSVEDALLYFCKVIGNIEGEVQGQIPSLKWEMEQPRREKEIVALETSNWSNISY